jgi:hypothetical protein
MRRASWVLLLSFGGAVDLWAQSSPFIDPQVESALVNELSGDIAFDHLRIITQWHRPGGSAGFFATARYVHDKAVEYGLEDVTWIDQVADDPSWTCKRAEAWLIEGEGEQAKETKLGSFAEVATSIADYSRPANVTAELADVGAGDRAADYEGKQVEGKVVLAYGNTSRVMEEAVWKRGAAGILSWASSRLIPLADGPDQITWQHVPHDDGPNGEKTTFAFVVSPRVGQILSDRLSGAPGRAIFAQEGASEKAPLKVRVMVESETLSEKKTAMVTARIRGTDPSLPEIILTGHLQEEKFSANDDGSGVVSVLEIGRALSRLIRESKLPRPRRGIRFWWCDEIYSEYRYFADHPGEVVKVLCNLNQDMVGAKQSAGGRVQYLSRTPWSRPSFLNDVVEGVLEAVVQGNNAYLDAWQAHSLPPGSPYSKPIFARLGTREPYHARAVPYYDSTDHLVFNDAWIGVPGISLTNWPDDYIHSSADDLWQIDSTQLERNAFVIAGSAWWIATADKAQVPALAAHVYAKSMERLARDAATALEILRDSSGEPAARLKAAQGLLSISTQVQMATLRSSDFALSGSIDQTTRDFIERCITSLAATGQQFQEVLADAFGSPHADAPAVDPVEARLAQRVPKRPVAALAEWLELRRRVEEKREAEERRKRDEKQDQKEKEEKERKLHRQMEVEIMNLVDGQRDAAAITRFIAAEAAAAGRWYYGEVTPELVEKFLEEQAKDGLVVW